MYNINKMAYPELILLKFINKLPEQSRRLCLLTLSYRDALYYARTNDENRKELLGLVSTVHEDVIMKFLETYPEKSKSEAHEIETKPNPVYVKLIGLPDNLNIIDDMNRQSMNGLNMNNDKMVALDKELDAKLGPWEVDSSDDSS